MCFAQPGTGLGTATNGLRPRAVLAYCHSDRSRSDSDGAVEEPAVVLLLLVIPTREHKRGAEESASLSPRRQRTKENGRSCFSAPFLSRRKNQGRKLIRDRL